MTQTDREILRLYRAGLGRDRIARELEISPMKARRVIHKYIGKVGRRPRSELQNWKGMAGYGSEWV